jgi:hypothetical protein
MRRLLAVTLVLSSALALSGCNGPCEDLGRRLCRCTPVGTTRDACERQIDDMVSERNPSESSCEARLDTCDAPAGSEFCEWLQTPCGKASCGLSDEPVHTGDQTGACDVASGT